VGIPVGLDTSRKKKPLVRAGPKRVLARNTGEEISTLGFWKLVCLTLFPNSHLLFLFASLHIRSQKNFIGIKISERHLPPPLIGPPSPPQVTPMPPGIEPGFLG